MSLIFSPRPEDFKFAEAKSPRLRIVTYSDAVRTIIVRGITKTGLIHDTYVTTSDRLIQTRIIALTEIPLTVLVETSTLGVQRGQLFCQFFLEFAGVPASILAADYLTTNQPLGWPGNQIRSSTDGTGAFLNINIPPPGNGNEFEVTVPVNTIWRLRSISYSLNTSAALGTRESMLYFFNPPNIFVAFLRPSATQAPSLQRVYLWNFYNIIPSPDSIYIAAQLLPLYLPAGSLIQTPLINQDVNDVFTDIWVIFEQWLNP